MPGDTSDNKFPVPIALISPWSECHTEKGRTWNMAAASLTAGEVIDLSAREVISVVFF